MPLFVTDVASSRRARISRGVEARHTVRAAAALLHA